MRAYTAAVISYNGSRMHDYTTKIEFIIEHELKQELEMLFADLEDVTGIHFTSEFSQSCTFNNHERNNCRVLDPFPTEYGFSTTS